MHVHMYMCVSVYKKVYWKTICYHILPKHHLLFMSSLHLAKEVTDFHTWVCAVTL